MDNREHKSAIRVIVSGGGTAGHIYPALAVAENLTERGVEVLFVGALGRMEMERVPKAGFTIVGLPIEGIKRSFSPGSIVRNLMVPFKMLRSTLLAKRIIKQFAPQVVIGFGGYASAPIMRAAQNVGVPTVMQEQNSYAGLTNRILAKRACAICTAYDGMEQFFPAQKITITGNPLRGNIGKLLSGDQAAQILGVAPDCPTILVTGGSLGTRTLNEAVLNFVSTADPSTDLQIIWQSGKYYFEEFEQRLASLVVPDGLKLKLVPFIERMDAAYAVADVVVCRAGASTISELQLIGLPAVFVPSPNVTADHQTANAQSIVDQNAAILVADSRAIDQAIPAAISLLSSSERLSSIRDNLRALGRPNAARDVADIALSFIPKLPQNRVKNVYFIGIGGIGMSALARFFAHQKHKVAGYDRVRTPLCEALQNEGIEITYDQSEQQIAPDFRDPQTTRVIYTPAVPGDQAQLCWFIDNGFEVIKRSEALGLLCQGKYTMAVAGTHGKSTTTTMVAWINHCAAIDGTGSAFLGAISKNFHSNIVMGSGDRIAVEADEFDRSFHQLHPAVSLITATDPDHLDIYLTEQAFREAFSQFARQTTETVIVKYGVELKTPATLRRLSYSLDNALSDYHAKNITLLPGGHYSFDVVTPTRIIENCSLSVVGKLNVENAMGAVALADQRGVDDQRLRTALCTFEGIERRFDLWYSSPKAVYMDDYAHHPHELKSMLLSVRQMFPGRHITICFQPHLYTRTRDFFEDFARSLSLADRVILTPIYPAREQPIDGVSSEMISDLVSVDKIVVDRDSLAQTLTTLDTDIVITAGAGDIDAVRAQVDAVIRSKSSR